MDGSILRIWKRRRPGARRDALPGTLLDPSGSLFAFRWDRLSHPYVDRPSDAPIGNDRRLGLPGLGRFVGDLSPLSVPRGSDAPCREQVMGASRS